MAFTYHQLLMLTEQLRRGTTVSVGTGQLCPWQCLLRGENEKDLRCSTAVDKHMVMGGQGAFLHWWWCLMITAVMMPVVAVFTHCVIVTGGQ